MSTYEPSIRRYWETIRHLHPEQLLFQAWRPMQPYLWPRPRKMLQDVAVRAGWGWQVPRPHLRQEASVLEGVFRYWNTQRQLDLESEWLARDLGSSWNFPVHYFDELAGMAADPERTQERAEALRSFMTDWIEQHVVERGDPWHPYATSVRVVNWLDALAHLEGEATAEWMQMVLHSLHRQVMSIPPQLERHLLGTHLLKNLKAILIAGAVFKDESMQKARAQALLLLQRELRSQVRADGGHMEPSAMYHCMATGDLLDLLNCKAALPAQLERQTREVAARMLDFATAVMTPTGDYPLQGDAWRGGELRPAQLRDYGEALGLDVSPPLSGLTFLADSGLATWRQGRHWLFADLAPVGPPHLPSHGHCDSLSFEWWVDDLAFLVDAGTFSYEDGDLRHACRSTNQHNTLQVDDEELHEIWSRFRVARRSSVQSIHEAPNEVTGVLVPWFDSSMRISRRFRFAEDRVVIQDAVAGSGEHRVVSRLHVHPECTVNQESAHVVTLQRGHTSVRLTWEGAPLEVQLPESSASYYAAEAGKLLANPVVSLLHEGPLPMASRLVLEIN